MSVAALPAPVPRPVRAVRLVRGAVLVAAAIASGFTFGLVGCLAAPRVVGVSAFTEMTGSMRPALQPGDVVLVQRIRARDAVAGQVVTFPDPSGRRRLLTHRVRAVWAERGELHFVTQGDANDGAERWSVPRDGEIGRVTHRIPLLGYGVAHVADRWGALLFVALPCLLLAVIELRRIWRRP